MAKGDKVPGGHFAKSSGAVCQWHTSSTDRAEGETLVLLRPARFAA